MRGAAGAAPLFCVGPGARMRWLLAVVVVGLAGCAVAGRPPVSAPPLVEEGELHVYLAPFPHERRQLAFSVREVAAVAEDGTPVPLQVRLPQVAAARLRGERLLATGRLPHGKYLGLRLAAADATLEEDGQATGLRLGAEPGLVSAPFDVPRGQAVVMSLSFDAARSFQDGGELTPAFAGAIPPRAAPGLVGACTSTRENGVTLFDTQTRTVTGVVATGLSPHGVALDAIAGRAWVALGGRDQLEVIDLPRGESAGRLQLRGGDEPRSILLLPDRRTLLVVNFRSQTASFVDALTAQELGRVGVGEDPWSAVQLHGANRAVVVNRRSNSLTVVDLATRQAIATVPTDPEPLFAQPSRDGRRLFVIHAASIYMTEYAVPAMTVTRRIRVGLGASALLVDPRTDLIYVAHAQEGRVEVYDAPSALPIDAFDVPGPVSQLVIDDRQDQLFALMPAGRAVAVVDLVSRRVQAVIDVPGEPFEVHLAAERR